MGYDKTFFGNPDYNFSDVEVHIARARVEHDIFDVLTFNASLQYANYDKFYANLVPGGGTTATTATLSGYESGTKRESLIGQANFIGTFETAGVGHTLLVGAEFTTSDTDSIRNRARFNNGADTSVTVDLADVITPPSFTLEPQRASTSDLRTFSFYVQEQIDFGIVQLVGGIRYDEFDLTSTDLVADFDGARLDKKWSPRLGLIVKPQDNISLYASFAESFLPQSGDQFTVLSQLTESLEPEKFSNYEAGLKWAIQRELLLTAAVFKLERSNSRSIDPDTSLTTLVGESTTKGFEIGLAGEVVPNLNVSLGYAYLDAEITASSDLATIGTPLQQVPESHFTAWARYDVNERLGFGAGLIHQTSQFASTSASAVTLPGYTRVDLAVFYDVSENVALQINVENLFDENYYPSAHGNNNIQPAEPLNASLSARVSF
jgi:catecholate siderophore receptor